VCIYNQRASAVSSLKLGRAHLYFSNKEIANLVFIEPIYALWLGELSAVTGNFERAKGWARAQEQKQKHSGFMTPCNSIFYDFISTALQPAARLYIFGFGARD
jgi:hypothetical protein